MRFFPRYYFQVLPVVVLMAARGFTLMSPRRREMVALLVLIPLWRFAPSYFAAATDSTWRDIAMDNQSRAAAAFVRGQARPGRHAVRLGLPAGDLRVLAGAGGDGLARFPAPDGRAGGPASEAIGAGGDGAGGSAARGTGPVESTFVVDGLGPYNPRLAITSYPDLREWIGGYAEVGRVGQTVVYRKR